MKIVNTIPTELTCLSLAPSSSSIKYGIVGGRNLLKLFSIQQDTDGTITGMKMGKDLSLTSSVDVAINPTLENVAAAANTKRTVELWELISTSKRDFVTLERASISKLSWQVSDPNTILIGGSDGLLRVADSRLQEPVHTVMDAKSREIRDCQFNPHDNCTLAACFDNGTVQIFDQRQPRTCSRRLLVHDGGASCLSYHPTRRGLLASGGRASGLPTQVGHAYKLKILHTDREAFTLRSIRVSDRISGRLESLPD